MREIGTMLVNIRIQVPNLRTPYSAQEILPGEISKYFSVGSKLNSSQRVPYTDPIKHITNWSAKIKTIWRLVSFSTLLNFVLEPTEFLIILVS